MYLGKPKKRPNNPNPKGNKPGLMLWQSTHYKFQRDTNGKVVFHAKIKKGDTYIRAVHGGLTPEDRARDAEVTV